MKIRLQVTHDGKPLKAVTLSSDALIGRGKGCNLRIASQQVSRQHCQIKIRSPKVFVEDLKSSNGTLLNGERIPAEKEMPLKNGSVIEVGPLKLVVQIATAAKPAPARVPVDPGEAPTPPAMDQVQKRSAAKPPAVPPPKVVPSTPPPPPKPVAAKPGDSDFSIPISDDDDEQEVTFEVVEPEPESEAVVDPLAATVTEDMMAAELADDDLLPVELSVDVDDRSMPLADDEDEQPMAKAAAADDEQDEEMAAFLAIMDAEDKSSGNDAPAIAEPIDAEDETPKPQSKKKPRRKEPRHEIPADDGESLADFLKQLKDD